MESSDGVEEELVVTCDQKELEETRLKERTSDDYEEKEENDTTSTQGNPGWADAMAKILGKQLPADKPAVLIKYKKAEREQKRKLEEHKKQKLLTQEKHTIREKNHVKPRVTNDENERVLRRIATKGVVKLFNAVNKHQKDLESKLKSAPTEAKKARVLKSVSKTSFLDMLKNNSNDAVAPAVNDGEVKDDRLSKWSILREDFMMGGKMKDWDKDDDDVEYDNEDEQRGMESAEEESE